MVLFLTEPHPDLWKACYYNKMNRFGIDIGGVIVKKAEGPEDTSLLSEDYLKTPAIEDAFSYIGECRKHFFGEQIYLVSACGSVIQQKTQNWLAHHDFYEKTGIPPHHVYFCKTREEKAPICKKLGVTH